MPLSRKLALDDGQIEEIMTASWNCRIATIGPGSRINLTPMWFGWAGGKIYIYGRGQKIANLRRDPTCTIIVDRNEKFPELQAIMMQGQTTVLEDAEAEAAEPHLAEAQIQMVDNADGNEVTLTA
jgi:nitroimidazol reductase NimA-like FMN-containing flavoprotein (pyridoxamine 5'-phosphate oxidase superfamily)